MNTNTNTEINLNQAIIKIRVDLQNSKLKKSGKNKSAGFSYFELSDFLPRLNELMLENGINDLITINENTISLTLIKGDERQVYEMPFKLFATPEYTKTDYKTGEVKTTKSMQDIQYLGALNTYYKRYLYLNAFGITDGEVIDSMDNTNLRNASEEEQEEHMKLTLELQRLIVDKGVDIDKMLEYFGVTKTTELTTTQYKQLITTLKARPDKNILEEAEKELQNDWL